MKLNANLVELRVKQEIAKQPYFLNYHGITLENVNEFLVHPYEIPVELDDGEPCRTIRQMWVVLQEFTSPTQGYLVVFDPEDGECPWGIAEHVGGGNYMRTIVASTFAEALTGM